MEEEGKTWTDFGEKKYEYFHYCEHDSFFYQYYLHPPSRRLFRHPPSPPPPPPHHHHHHPHPPPNCLVNYCCSAWTCVFSNSFVEVVFSRSPSSSDFIETRSTGIWPPAISNSESTASWETASYRTLEALLEEEEEEEEWKLEMKT